MADGDNIRQFPRHQLVRPRFTMAELRHRLGYFSIADQAIEAWPDTVMEVMGRCIILQTGRCDHGATIYLALSREFDVLTDGQRPPFYEWVFEKGAMHARRFRREEDGSDA